MAGGWSATIRVVVVLWLWLVAIGLTLSSFTSIDRPDPLHPNTGAVRVGLGAICMALAVILYDTQKRLEREHERDNQRKAPTPPPVRK